MVSRKNSNDIVKTASVDRTEPRRVPSSKSMGTLRYISSEANLAILLLLVGYYDCGVGVSVSCVYIG